MSLIRTAVLVAVVVLTVNLAPKVFNSEANNLMGSNYSLRERAEIMNRDCPFVIDENTRLDSVTLPKKGVLQNNFTLLQDHLDDIDVEAFQNIFKPEITPSSKPCPRQRIFEKQKPRSFTGTMIETTAL